MLLVGILLIVIAIPTKDNTNQDYITNGNNTNMEIRLKNLLEQIKGVGEVHVMVTYQDEMVEGVVVVAEGGGNAIIVKNITEVVNTSINTGCDFLRIKEKLYRFNYSKYSLFKDNFLSKLKVKINLDVRGQR